MEIKVPRARFFKKLIIDDESVKELKRASYTGILYKGNVPSGSEIFRTFCTCGHGTSGSEVDNCPRCGGKLIYIDNVSWNSPYPGALYTESVGHLSRNLNYFRVTTSLSDNDENIEAFVKTFEAYTIIGDGKGNIGYIEYLHNQIPGGDFTRCEEELAEIIPEAINTISAVMGCYAHTAMTALQLLDQYPLLFQNHAKNKTFISHVIKTMCHYGNIVIPNCPSSMNPKYAWDSTKSIKDFTLEEIAWMCKIPPELEDWNKCAQDMGYYYGSITWYNGVRDFLSSAIGKFYVYRWKNGLTKLSELTDCCIYGDPAGHNNWVLSSDVEWLAEKYVKENCDVLGSAKDVISCFANDYLYLKRKGIVPNEDNLRRKNMVRFRKTEEMMLYSTFDEDIDDNPLEAMKKLMAVREEQAKARGET